MAAPPRSSASWERVLAAVEADAARAAALLVSDDASATAGIEYDGYDAAAATSAPGDDATGVPATWRLPVTATGAAGGPGLTAVAAARAVAGYAAATGNVPTANPSVNPSANAAANQAAGALPNTKASTAPDAVSGRASAAAHTGPDSASPAPATAATPAVSGPTTPPAAYAGQTGAVPLPDPADMPPMTPEQRERFAALHARITDLQGQLAAAMAEAEAVLANPPARRPDPQPRPELVDRRL